LGAGRRRKEDPVDSLAGIYLFKKESDPVDPGETLCSLHASSEERLEGVEEAVLSAYSFTESPLPAAGRILDRYADGGWMHPSGSVSV
jgi:pyrimidine-nucleoside phosphorylase